MMHPFRPTPNTRNRPGLKLLGGLLVTACLCLASQGFSARAAEWTIQVKEAAPPKELDDSFKKQLQPRGIQLLNKGKTVFEFWFPNSLALKGKPSSPLTTLDRVDSTGFLGVARVATDKRDYRDDELYAGLYTMRFALLPQDGNHLGASEFSYFAILTPAKLDPKLDGSLSLKQLIKASQKDSATDHPFILSLRPVGKDEGTYPRITEPAEDHECLRIKLPTTVQGKKLADSPCVIDLVFKGVAEL